MTEKFASVGQFDEKMKTVEEIVAIDQTEIRKIENKLRKLKLMMSSSLESLEERIVPVFQDKVSGLELGLLSFKDETESSISDLKQRFDGFENCDVVNITRRLATARGKINEIIEKTSELDIQLKEVSRDKSSNLLLHGLTFKEGETLEYLVKSISDIFRTRLGIGREISLVESQRLISTRVEVNGCPPILLCFEHQHDRDTVLSKAACLDKPSGIIVSYIVWEAWDIVCNVVW